LKTSAKGDDASKEATWVRVRVRVDRKNDT